MALSVTLGTLITRCQQRANAVGSDQIETSEWKEMVSELYGELHGAVSETGARYFESEATLNLANLALPSDHLSTVGVDYVYDSSGRRFELAELMVQERNVLAGLTGQAYAWSLVAGSIVLRPTPTTGTYKHIYLPQPTDYSTASTSTSIDLINTHGMRFVTWGVAAIALHRSESNQQAAMLARDQAKELLVTWAVNRALNMPRRRVITDYDFSNGGDWWNPSAWWNRP